MIKDSVAFFGRQREIEEIFTNLENFQNTSIVGERRIGKSSLLWFVSQAECYSQHSDEGEKPFVMVFFDFQKVANLTPETFFKLLAENLKSQLADEVEPAREDFDTYQEYFDALVDSIYSEYKIVICLKENHSSRSSISIPM